MAYAAHSDKETVGRYPDGAAEVYVMNVPTIGRANLHTSYNTAVDQSGVQGIGEMAAVADLSLRHASGHLVVRSSTCAEVGVEMWQTDGRQVLSSRIYINNGKAELNIAHFSPGCYVADGHGGVRTLKFIVSL